eukprot:m.247945 g.247945  ORF g.247945 m.247945 type:complete len:130 (+) comp40278_c0_seq7:2110-2499(+)
MVSFLYGRRLWAGRCSPAVQDLPRRFLRLHAGHHVNIHGQFSGVSHVGKHSEGNHQRRLFVFSDDCGTVKNLAVEKFFLESQVPTYERVGAFMQSEEDSPVQTAQEGVERVKKWQELRPHTYWDPFSFC